jgi:hypothetical protein
MSQIITTGIAIMVMIEPMAMKTVILLPTEITDIMTTKIIDHGIKLTVEELQALTRVVGDIIGQLN